MMNHGPGTVVTISGMKQAPNKCEWLGKEGCSNIPLFPPEEYKQKKKVLSLKSF
jgi:hypothetical protein